MKLCSLAVALLVACFVMAGIFRSDIALPSAQGSATQSAPGGFELEEATISDLVRDQQAGRRTARRIAEQYLSRIHALDAERQTRGPRGPLHGVPILIKDNIDTADHMSTSAASLALEGSIAAEDAFIVGRLRAAGAVILGKTNLSEWANFRSTH